MPGQVTEYSKRHLPACKRLAAAATVGLALLLCSTASTSQNAAAEAVHKLRGDVPTGKYMRSQLEKLSQKRESLLSDLESLDAELASTSESLRQLSSADQRLASEIEELLELMRRMAVGMFVGDISRPKSDFEYLTEVGGMLDMQWSQHLAASINQLRRLESVADADLVKTVRHIEGIRRDIEILNSRLTSVGNQEEEAQELLVVAEAWDRAEHAISTGKYGLAPIEKWEALRFCESSDNYKAVSKTKKYRGAYQFDLTTWGTVGGKGDPAKASASEQDARARELYARRGADPWPTCGRFLK